MSVQKVDAETAEAEFCRFVEAMDLDVDPEGMDDDDKASFKGAKRVVMRAIQDGRLVVNENGEPVFTPDDGGNAITFHEPSGASLMAMDQKKKNHDVAKTYAILGDMTKQSSARFSKMSNRNLKVCQSLFVLFFG